MFEQASRLKLRFQTTKGVVKVEDLWDLQLTVLNDAYKVLVKELRETETDSLLETPSKAPNHNQLRADIIKHVVETRRAEAAKKKNAAANKAEKDKLLAILENKQNEELQNMSADELKQKIAALES